MQELQKGYGKTMRRKLPVSETFCRFSAQMSGGNLLLCPAEIPRRKETRMNAALPVAHLSEGRTVNKTSHPTPDLVATE